MVGERVESVIVVFKVQVISAKILLSFFIGKWQTIVILLPPAPSVKVQITDHRLSMSMS